MAELKDGKLVESKQVSVETSCEEACRLREHYRKDIEYYTQKLAEVEAQIAKMKELGWKE